MDRKEVLNKLKPIIYGNKDEERIRTRPLRSISVRDFCDRFRGSDIDYNSLIGHENTESGWKNIFADWRNQGLLN